MIFHYMQYWFDTEKIYKPDLITTVFIDGMTYEPYGPTMDTMYTVDIFYFVSKYFWRTFYSFNMVTRINTFGV